MKNKSYCWIFIVLFIVSCGRKESNVPVFGYYLSLDKTKDFRLNIHENNNLINFHYKNVKEPEQDLQLKYNLAKDYLIVTLDTFFPTDKIYNSKKLKFKMYQRKEVSSHNRILIFNENYGLLANLVFGADQLFLKDSISKTESKVLFKELFLNLSKINKE